MEHRIEHVKYLGKRVFSNKRYSIHVMLFDQGMARARICYKKGKTGAYSSIGGAITCVSTNVGESVCTTLGNVCIICRWTNRHVVGFARCCARALRSF